MNDRLKLFLITLLGGFFGIHRFYLKQNWLGILYLLTGGIWGIGWIIDIILILFTDKLLRPMREAKEVKEVNPNSFWYRFKEQLNKKPTRKAPITPRCPKCGSQHLTANKKGFGVGKATIGVLTFGVYGLLAGGIGANKIKVTCLSCGKEFKL